MSSPNIPRGKYCEALSKILVSSLVPGTKHAALKCTSDADFIVHCSTNYFIPGGAPTAWKGYSINVKSTGSGFGSASPTFTVGGVPNDEITISALPGTACFITLQTRCRAKARIELV